jgi:hypothetical protein
MIAFARAGHRHHSTGFNDNAVSLRWFVVAAAIWLLAAIISIGRPAGLRFEQYMFLVQDAPVGAMLVLGLALLPWPRGSGGRILHIAPWKIALAILISVLVAWLGHHWLMSGYALSRDEALARMTASVLAQGRLGMAIPPEWRAYHDALSPAFLNPMGGDRYWISIYLPGSAAIEALVSQTVDPALTQPLLLGVGLVALWDVSRILLPDRTDARAVVMLLALTSGQLLFNAMTPYAMTAHFSLNMVWLALFLRNRPLCHAGALMIGALALALHKVQFHVLFAGPILATLVWQRRWLLSAVYASSYALLLLFWMKLYPIALIATLDLPVVATAATGTSLSPRLASLQPLLYVSRFFAWNNALLLPLAMIGSVAAVRAWHRDAIRPRSILFVALAIGCGLGLMLTVHQGLGWGYRYLHGYIGAFCLLAGLGWTRLCSAPASLRPIVMTSLLALLLLTAQAVMIYRFVSPYARLHADARARQADVVLVDTRGSAFAQDIVRVGPAPVRRPVLMDMSKLDEARIDALCRRYSVQVIDRNDYRRAGVMEDDTRPDAPHVAAMRVHLDRTGCVRERSASGS